MVEFTQNFHDEGTPSGTSQGVIIDEEFVSVKSSIRSIIGNEHEFNTAAADHVRGTHKKGSARAYLDVQSNLSVSGTSYIGRLYVASDTSRIFCIPDSGQTIFLGGANVPEVMGSMLNSPDVTLTYPGQNARQVILHGRSRTDDSGKTDIQFNLTYSNPPTVVVGRSNDDTAQKTNYVQSTTASTISVKVFGYDAAGNLSTTSFDWISIGTVDF